MWCAKQAKDARDCLKYARITLERGIDGVSIYADDPGLKAEQVRLTKMDAHEVQERLDDSMVLRTLDGRKSVQWAFMKLDTIRALSEAVKGKIHVQIFRPYNN